MISDHRWNTSKLENSKSPEIIKYLVPGCGFGGSCFPKDVEAIVNIGNKKGLKMEILKSVLEINRNSLNKLLVCLMMKLET